MRGKSEMTNPSTMLVFHHRNGRYTPINPPAERFRPIAALRPDRLRFSDFDDGYLPGATAFEFVGCLGSAA